MQGSPGWQPTSQPYARSHPGGQAGWDQQQAQQPGWDQQFGWAPPSGPPPRNWVLPVAVLSVVVLVTAVAVGAVLLLRGGADPDRPVAAGPTARATTNDAVSVATAAGARLDVPAGSVPAAASGQPGAMDIAIHSVSDAPAPAPGSVPEGLQVDTSAALQLEPSGQTFSQPVMISVPLPDGTDPDGVGGLARYEPTTGEWSPVASYLDPDTGELRAELMSFSLYSPWYDNRPDRNSWQAENGGWVAITNVRVGPEGWYGFPHQFFGSPQPRSMHTSTTYGVSINAYSLTNPNLSAELDWYIYRDSDGTRLPLTVWASPGTGRHNPGSPGGTREFWLPAGTYTLAETFVASEINRHDPLYLPLLGLAYRPLGELVIEPGGRYEFVEEERLNGRISADDGWLIGREPAFGQEMPAPLEADIDPAADGTTPGPDSPFTEGEVDLGIEPGTEADPGAQTPGRTPPTNQPDAEAFCNALLAVPESELGLEDPAIEGNPAAVQAAFDLFIGLFEEVVRTAPPDLLDDARTILDLLVGLEAEMDRQNAWGLSLSEQDRIADEYFDRADQGRLDQAFDNIGARIPELCDVG